jgi:hypothetical protein
MAVIGNRQKGVLFLMQNSRHILIYCNVNMYEKILLYITVLHLYNDMV